MKILHAFLFLLLPVSALAAVAVFPSDPSVFRQPPGHFGGFGSDGEIITVADDFTMTRDTFITGVKWWGGNFNPSPEPQHFTLRFYSNAGGEPGELLGEYTVGVAFQSQTGALVGSGVREIEYSVGLSEPLLARAGIKYWMSVVAPPRDIWVWEVSGDPLSQDMGVQRLGATGEWLPYYHETAFELVGVPEPGPLAFSVLVCGALMLRRSGRTSR